MKNMIFLLIATGVFVSCKKQVDSNKDVAAFTPLMKQVISEKGQLSIKLAYGLLSEPEMQLLWETKYNTILKNDLQKFTADQKEIVMELQDILKKKGISYMRQNPTFGEDYLKTRLPYFEQHFDKQQLNMLIECAYYEEDFSIFQSSTYFGKFEGQEKNDVALAGEASPDNVMPTCYCRYSLSCTGWGNSCIGGCGVGTKADCGVFGSSKCNGICSQGLID
ncbi:MAG: bacteriocin fulvocin C-related protein [Chitinophagaceae bacterium]